MNSNGGYRRTRSFAFVCLIYHATEIFCRRNYNYRNDSLGKTVGQMIGAARSARQNIVEASSRGAFSYRQEALQYDVARGSLHELAGDYESFILGQKQPPWSENEERAKEVSNLKVDEFKETEDVSHKFASTFWKWKNVSRHFWKTKIRLLRHNRSSSRSDGQPRC